MLQKHKLDSLKGKLKWQKDVKETRQLIGGKISSSYVEMQVCKTHVAFCCFFFLFLFHSSSLWSLFGSAYIVSMCKLSSRQLFCFFSERSICPNFLCLHSREYSTKAEWAGCIWWWRCQAWDVEVMCWNVTSWSNWWKCQGSHRTYLQLTFGEVYVE